MTEKQRLEALLAEAKPGKRWLIGRVPHHFKRCSVDEKDRDRIALLGAKAVFVEFGAPTYYCQSLIAGAVLSGEFDDIIIVTPSQYGKSWLLGRLALMQAYNGRRLYVTGATTGITDVIMQHMIDATDTCSQQMKVAMAGAQGSKIDKLRTSLSKKKIAMTTGGMVESITLGDTYGDITRNKAVGRGGDYFVDEAATASEDALQELGRRDFTGIGEEKSRLVMISNPHKPGIFYDALTQDHPSPRTFILWMDALTAVEEGRWTKERVLESDFAKHVDTLQRYLLCELPSSGMGMFSDPEISDEEVEGFKVMGVDAAYKGKDDIVVCIGTAGQKVKASLLEKVPSSPWIDGVTSELICDQLADLYHKNNCALCCVDVGYGVWIIEGLNRRGVNALGIQFGSGPTKARVSQRHYAAAQAYNMRAEMHLDVQSLIESQGLILSDDVWTKIKPVFPFITADRRANNKVQVRTKTEIKAMLGHSPDEFDAFLLMIHAAVLCLADTRAYIT